MSAARQRPRGYSREFPATATSARYLLDDIPADLWSAVRSQATRDGLSVRALILQLLRAYVAARQPEPDPIAPTQPIAPVEVGGDWRIVSIPGRDSDPADRAAWFVLHAPTRRTVAVSDLAEAERTIARLREETAPWAGK